MKATGYKVTVREIATNKLLSTTDFTVEEGFNGAREFAHQVVEQFSVDVVARVSRVAGYYQDV